ncbi:hypothetical protein B0H16DRAFT_788315 [Mycena metata]|uniref:Uncharacterized protein n=1 Tax=Mycena metata TaxID=1033252 RepID=A0AAD7NAX4_9AGAR|nr:hypothetical protein B0H16DRAFT_788315 [Mycena metata]
MTVTGPPHFHDDINTFFCSVQAHIYPTTMPASSPKDRFHAIFIHRVPPHLSSKEFESKVEAWMDECVQLPVVKKNAIKAEMTLDHMREMLMDRELIRLCDRGKEFHFQDGASALSVDIMAKTEFVVPQNAARIMAIFKAPPHVALKDYSTKFHRCIEECFALPEVKKNRVKYEVWEQNNAIDDCLPSLGHVVAESMLIGMGECEVRLYRLDATISLKAFNAERGQYRRGEVLLLSPWTCRIAESSLRIGKTHNFNG